MVFGSGIVFWDSFEVEAGGILLIFLFSFENKHLKLDLKGLLWFLGGCVFIPSLFLLYFTFKGALSDFIYSVLIINKKYLLNVPGDFFSKAVFGFKEITTIAKYENSLIWAFGMAGLLYIFIKDRSRENMLLGLWGAASFVAISFSGLFFGHYFIQLIPALCLLSAFVLKRIKEKVGFYGGAAILLFSILLILFILPVQYLYHFRFSPEEISEHKYRSKDFVISHQLAKEFKNFMKPDETILVWSANPELYFYLKKKAPTKYINYLKWMDDEKIKKEILGSVLAEKPDYIVRTSYGPNYKELIDFVRENYRLFMKIENWMVFKRKW
jgi:hypothetical protein